MKRVIARARNKRKMKHKKTVIKYDSDSFVCSEDEDEVSTGMVGTVLNNKYLVLKYINNGSFCRIWLVADLTNGNYYALKNQFPKYNKEALKEIDIFRQINHCEQNHTGEDNHSQHQHGHCNLMNLCDYFVVNTEVYLVYELLGDELFLFLNGKDGKGTKPMELPTIKLIMKDILSGLKHLHSKNIVHTDLKLENILFVERNSEIKKIIKWFSSLSPLKMIEEECKLTDDERKMSRNKRRKIKKRHKKTTYIKLGKKVIEYFNTDAEIIEEADEELVEERNFDTSNILVKICDFGNSCFRNNHSTKTIQTRYYRAPEVIYDEYDIECDMWSIGCIIYELITGEYLFDIISGKNKLERDRKHLALMTEILGKIPKLTALQSKRREDFFDKKGRLIKYRNQMNNTNLEELIQIERDNLSEEEIKTTCNLLKKMLEYDPAKRITAAESLNDVWFN